MSDDNWAYEPAVWSTGNGSSFDWDEQQHVVTQVVEPGDILHEPIRNLIRGRFPDHFSFAPLYLVTEGKWSGYSEYTITSTWQEVHVHHGGVDIHWDDMGGFMRSLANANPPEERL